MRIAYDHQIFSLQEYGGVSRYFVEIAKRIQKTDGLQVKVLSPLYVNKYLADEVALRVEGVHVPRIPRTHRILETVNTQFVRWALNSLRPDILHETYYRETSLAPPGTKIVITIYDMIYEKFPQYFGSSDATSAKKRVAVERADHVICISENTRSDLVEMFGVNPRKTSVIYLGAPVLPPPSTPPDKTKGQYIAYVGLRGGYKNFTSLLGAFGLSEFLRKNFSVACFGGGPFTPAEQGEIDRAGLNPTQVTHVQGNDESLVNFYRNATAFVYPSLYEGFGLPPLESMAAACPVVCSQTASLPEVCGEAAEYFNPSSIESIASSIERVAKSELRRQELVALGLKQVRKFSWDECARQTAALYGALLGDQ